MNSRLCRIALLATRATRYHARPSLTKIAAACQVRQISCTSIVREQYLQGYKDNERFHGKYHRIFFEQLLILNR